MGRGGIYVGCDVYENRLEATSWPDVTSLGGVYSLINVRSTAQNQMVSIRVAEQWTETAYLAKSTAYV